MQTNNKLREALKSVMDNLQIHAVMPCEQITMNRAEVCAMIEDCRAALAEPVKNCEVGTPEEQGERLLSEYRERYQSRDKQEQVKRLKSALAELTGETKGVK